MTTIKLTTSQQTVLEAAANRQDGSIHPMPKNLKGGAALKVINALEKKDMINNVSMGKHYKDWQITDDGYRAIGQEPPVQEIKTITAQETNEEQAEVIVAITETKDELKAEEKPVRKTRQGTKQAKVITLLQRPIGATIDQIVDETGWKPHYADVRIMPNHVSNPLNVGVIVAMGAA